MSIRGSAPSMRRIVAAIGVACACAGMAPPTVGEPRSTAQARSLDWRRIATLEDRSRLRGWRGAWVSAIAKARAAGAGPAIAAEGLLFDPYRALDDPVPPPGVYRCRVFKMGAQAPATRDWTAYPAFDCRVDLHNGMVEFAKIAGPQRPIGTVYPDTGSRAVFLGTMVLGDERRAYDYGRDAGRDMAGFVERIEAKRWRVILPMPRYESLLDVVELVPAG